MQRRTERSAIDTPQQPARLQYRNVADDPRPAPIPRPISKITIPGIVNTGDPLQMIPSNRRGHYGRVTSLIRNNSASRRRQPSMLLEEEDDAG